MRRHRIAHFFFMVLLVGLAILIFGSSGQGGPLTGGLMLGAQVYSLLILGGQGDLTAMTSATENIAQFGLIFFINLIIYYILAAILTFFYRLFFGK